ncbi:unnamed protein product, partial [Brassica rapa subsp. trilocularis]
MLFIKISFHIRYGRTISRLVHRCSQNFRLSDSLLTIWFSDSTSLDVLISYVHNLSDVISELTAVRSTKLEGFWGDSRVVVANSIKPKMVEGVFLNTHVPSFLRGYAKVEPLTIAELNEFVIISEPQVVQSVFTMTKLHNVRAYEAGNLIVGTSLSGIAIKKPQASKSLKVMKK